VTLQAFLTETPSCAGDRDDTSDVTVNEIITLVNIALAATYQVVDRAIRIATTKSQWMILTAVNAALSGCSSAAWSLRLADA
jgi:hypothetical protein